MRWFNPDLGDWSKKVTTAGNYRLPSRAELDDFDKRVLRRRAPNRIMKRQGWIGRRGITNLGGSRRGGRSRNEIIWGRSGRWSGKSL